MYRELKHSYERTYQKPISDISWYRLISQLRQFLDFSVESANASLIIKSIANLKRTHRNFRISSEGFNESWEIFQYYYQQKSSLTCAEFLSEISQIVDLSQVSKTSIYNWFIKAGIPYRHEKKYPTADLALVAFQATKCLKSREMKRVEKAIQTIDVFVAK